MVLNVVVLGVGDRGTIYGSYAIEQPDKMKVVGAADPNKSKLNQFAELHMLDQDQIFLDWRSILKADLDIDAVIITLPDNLHYEATKEALQSGYHVLLEKPMSTSVNKILELVELERSSEGILQICHVLRYTKFYRKVKEVVESKKIGDIVSIHMSENVGYYHYAHSYIRGNWSNRDETGPMILTKSSHDLDILYWLAGDLPSKISSFGSQQFFGKENMPEGAPKRCIDGCPVEESCLYYAPRIYLQNLPILHAHQKTANLFEKFVINLGIKHPHLQKLPLFRQLKDYSGWPVSVITEEPENHEKRIQALQEGPYGRCVYDVDDHDVIDHQVTTIEFQNGMTASFLLHGHSSEEKRIIRIEGTRGTLEGIFSFNQNHLEITDSISGKSEVLIRGRDNRKHGGGDIGIIEDFVENASSNRKPMTNAETSSISHFMALIADEARKSERVIHFQEYVEQ